MLYQELEKREFSLKRRSLNKLDVSLLRKKGNVPSFRSKDIGRRPRSPHIHLRIIARTSLAEES
jgi:hypothetical protein